MKEMRNEKRTPLPNSRPGSLPTYTEDSSPKSSYNGKKRALNRGDGEDETDPVVRAPKRCCKGLQSPPSDVDWSTDENKDNKPPVLFVQLARNALLKSEEQVLTLDGIIASIQTDYAYYRLSHDDDAWKASIYNGIRSSKVFERVGKSTVIYVQRWKVKDEYRTERTYARKCTSRGRSQVPFAVQFAVPYTWSNPPPEVYRSQY